jgi:hypothetical protein
MTTLRVEPIEEPGVTRAPTMSVARWIPLAWILLFFASSFRFTGHRDVNTAVTGVASLENAIELAIYGVFGALAGLRLLLRTPRFRPTGVFLLGAFSLLALASAMWSLIPLFTIVRAVQLVVLTLLVAVSAGLWSEGLRSFDRDWRRIWTVFLFLVLLFSVAGFIWPNWQSGRFAWPYLHTGTTSEYLAVASLVAMSMRFERGWGLRGWAMRLIPIYLAGSLVAPGLDDHPQRPLRFPGRSRGTRRHGVAPPVRRPTPRRRRSCHARHRCVRVVLGAPARIRDAKPERGPVLHVHRADRVVGLRPRRDPAVAAPRLRLRRRSRPPHRSLLLGGHRTQPVDRGRAERRLHRRRRADRAPAVGSRPLRCFCSALRPARRATWGSASSRRRSS